LLTIPSFIEALVDEPSSGASPLVTGVEGPWKRAAGMYRSVNFELALVLFARRDVRVVVVDKASLRSSAVDPGSVLALQAARQIVSPVARVVRMVLLRVSSEDSIATAVPRPVTTRCGSNFEK
jgi:hypothetical protein